MTAKEQDFEMNEGESKRLVAPQTDDLDDGGDLNISGRLELKWVLKTREGGSVITEKTESGGSDVSVTDESIGAYTVLIRPEDTNGELNQTEDTFFHKVRLTDSTGHTSDLSQGEITVSKA